MWDRDSTKARNHVLNSFSWLFCLSFDEILELSQKGDNSAVDMLVGDIYGGLDYSKVLYPCMSNHSKNIIFH